MEAIWLFGAVVYFMVALPMSVYLNMTDRTGYEELPPWVVITFTCLATTLSAIVWPLMLIWILYNMRKERNK